MLFIPDFLLLRLFYYSNNNGRFNSWTHIKK